METARNPEVLQVRTPEEQHIRASDLLTYFTMYADKIKVLSLDCFDTLLWRKTIAPKDVFYDMHQGVNFQRLSVTAANRIDAEAYARALMFTNHGHHEVNLHDIYHIGFPALTSEDIEALSDDELSAEIQACYAFPPIIELMRAATACGIKIVIVSNTYFKEPQLKILLKNTLPQDVFDSIHTVFCSCEYLKSKNNGLFSVVIPHLNEQPHTILHIGDNVEADLTSAKRVGINALHLLQFNEKQVEFLRLQTTAATMTDLSIHYLRGMSSPFRGLFSLDKYATDRPEGIIGYMSIGPIMYTFARYLCEEVEQLKREGKCPKVLFLMRDAYLPSLACEALEGAPIGQRIRISRFCAVAASFRSRDDIARYVAGGVDPGFLHITCRQLLMSEAQSSDIIQRANASAEPLYCFTQLVLEQKNVEYIIKQSIAYWERFKKYLQQVEKIENGDTLVMVDIGYSGRTQRSLTPILQSELGVDVLGRYLISLNVLEWKLSRKGLIDPSWCDDRMMQMLSYGNLLLEELVCSADNSVEDYDEKGQPVFAPSSAKGGQREKTSLIQAECLRFIHDAKKYFTATGSSFPISMLRDSVAAELARRAFFPLAEEISYLQEYHHDENRGANLGGITFDEPEKELASLRKHGLWFMNQNPYGLRSAGFELSFTLMAQQRHGCEVTLSDLSLRRENILVMKVKNNQQIEKVLMNAAPTYDGYFSLWFVVDKSDMQVAILFGLHYQALQIEAVELIDADYFYNKNEMVYTKDARHDVQLNQMMGKDDDFYECSSKSSALIVQLKPSVIMDTKHVLRVVFRPIIKRKPEV